MAIVNEKRAIQAAATSAVGPRGKVQHCHAWYDGAAASGDTILLAGDLAASIPGGSRIFAIQEAHAALGAGVTLEFGFRPFEEVFGGTVEDTDAFAAGIAAASAGASYRPFMSIRVEDAVIPVVKVGGAGASGRIEVFVFYIAQGQR